MLFLRLPLLVLLTIISAPIWAAEPAWYQAIQRTIVAQLPTTTVSYDIEILSPTKGFEPLAQCDEIQASFNQPPARIAGRMIIKLQCDHSAQPIYAQVHVSVVADYWVAAHDLPAQHTLTADDIKIVQGEINRLPRHALLAETETMTLYLGQQLKRSIPANTVLQATLLAAPHVVNMGDDVVIELQGDGFSISRVGTALANGAINDTIRVRLNNQQLLTVKVIGPGRAIPL